jgi:phosphate transport system protein
MNIAHFGREYLEESSGLPLADLPKMGAAVQTMTRDALDAFLRQDENTANSVLLQDDAVDAFKRSIFDQLIDHMKQDPSTVDCAMNLILISRNLERIGDHATNIAEDVIFVSSGIDIRHGHHKTLHSADESDTAANAKK